jgi:hypothetical protein
LTAFRASSKLVVDCLTCSALFAERNIAKDSPSVAIVTSVSSVSAEEAQSASARLWKGNRQRTLDKILASLDAERIPSHFEEIVNVGPQITIFGIPLRPLKSTFEYEVWVLHTDVERARSAIGSSRMPVSKTDDAITCLDDVPDLARLAARQQFFLKWYQAVGLVPLGLFVFIVFRFFPNSNSSALDALVGASLIWPLLVVIYTAYLWLTLQCPACKNRFGLGENCRSCNLPRHRDSTGFLANSR